MHAFCPLALFVFLFARAVVVSRNAFVKLFLWEAVLKLLGSVLAV